MSGCCKYPNRYLFHGSQNHDNPVDGSHATSVTLPEGYRVVGAWLEGINPDAGGEGTVVQNSTVVFPDSEGVLRHVYFRYTVNTGSTNSVAVGFSILAERSDIPDIKRSSGLTITNHGGA